MRISSRANPQVRAARALITRRKERERTGRYFIEGIHLVAAALAQQPERIEQAVVSPELLTSGFGQEVLTNLRRIGVPALEVTAEVFESLCSKEVSQGIGAVMRQRWDSLRRVCPGPGEWWVALSGVQYPGNLGTILRTGDAVGCAGAILLDSTADPFDPGAVRASMGGLFSHRLIRATTEEFAAWARSRNCPVIAASPHAANDYRQMVYPTEPFVLLMGCERGGLTPRQEEICAASVRIPMVGRCDSLNLAVSTSVIFYEVFHQQKG